MAVLALLLAALVVVAQACTLPPGGCDVEKVCKQLDSLVGYNSRNKLYSGKVDQGNFRSSKLVGYYKALYNSVDGKKADEKGGAPLNYEIFTEMGANPYPIPSSWGKNSLGDCCTLCAQTSGCHYYHWFESPKKADAGPMPDFKEGSYCYLLMGPPDNKGEKNGAPNSGTKQNQAANEKKGFPMSWVGGLCNARPDIKNDPHLVGAKGTRFDFTGALDTSFCLVSDARFHVNILLRGYAANAEAMTTSDDVPVHSWIKELGFVWADASNARHSMRLVARAGKEQTRGDGFLVKAEVDGQAVDVPKSVGDSIVASGARLTKAGEEVEGPFDVDVFTLEVVGVAKVTLKMRAAHPLLQTAEDAQVHFNVQLDELVTTPAIHGVLGQTFRNTEERFQRALKFSHLSQLLGHPFAADKDEGAGFLDGQVKDYAATSVVAPDCKYSAFTF